MDQALLITLVLGAVLLCYLVWGFVKMPHESRQILAVMPIRKKNDGRWEGLNFSYYGLLIANAMAVSAGLAIFLLGSAGIPFMAVVCLCAVILAIVIPSSKIMAFIVEGKRHTLTTGGAVFVGTLIAPLAIKLTNGLLLGQGPAARIDPIPVLAAFAVSYCMGEGLGRLACISFGCCYGKPLADLSPRFAKLFDRFSFTFNGDCKKAVYASGLSGVKVFPIQAVTALIYLIASMAGMLMFLWGWFAQAFLIVTFITHAWRFASEFLRADYRGSGNIASLSAYQLMGLGAVLIAVVYVIVLPSGDHEHGSISKAASNIANLEFLMAMQLLWAVCFYYFGKSSVTGSSIELFVHKGRA